MRMSEKLRRERAELDKKIAAADALENAAKVRDLSDIGPEEKVSLYDELYTCFVRRYFDDVVEQGHYPCDGDHKDYAWDVMVSGMLGENVFDIMNAIDQG